MARATTGITERRTAKGEKRWMAEAWDNVAQRRAYRTFPSRAAAVAWRRDMQTRIARGDLRVAAPTLVSEVWTQWLDAAERGQVRARGGATFKPGVLAGYRQIWEGRLLPTFGGRKVGDLRRADVQRAVDMWLDDGLAPSTIRNQVTALRTPLNWAMRQELINANPCVGLVLPSGGETRDRIAAPDEARRLIDALPDVQDRALWACAFFLGLRRGELLALRWDCVDLDARTVRVHPERGNFDPKTGTFGSPKSKMGVRTVGIPRLLAPYLREVDAGADDELVFHNRAGRPVNPRLLLERARKAWAAAGLEAIELHSARHTFASYLIAAQVAAGRFNPKAIQTAMGHSSIQVTYDRYGKLFPGSSDETRDLLDAWLDCDTVAVTAPTSDQT